MRVNKISVSSLLLTTACAVLLPTELVHEFPNGTWLENIAVRPQGQILLTLNTSPQLYQVDPLKRGAAPLLVHTFPEFSTLSGITETYPDVFFIAGRNSSHETGLVVPGSNRIFGLNFTDQSYTTAYNQNSTNPPTIQLHQLASLPNAGLLNGLTALSPTTILAADSIKGCVWAVDTRSGLFKIVIKDPLMAPPRQGEFGVNGIKVFGDLLYFTNTARSLFGAIKINITTGEPMDNAMPIASDIVLGYDDFAIDNVGNAFAAVSAGNSIQEIHSDGYAKIIAGDLNSTAIAQPTSAAFGRTMLDSHVLYVSTTGGLAVPVNGDVIIGGQVVAVNMAGYIGSS